MADIFAKNYWWYAPYYIDEFGSLFYPYPDGNYNRQPNLVLGIKYHCKKGALRAGLNFRYSESTRENEDDYGSKLSFNNFGTAINLGYEWHSTFGRVNVYYGFDGSFSTTNYFVKSESFGSTYNSTDENSIVESTMGISPLLGVNYFITPNLSIGTEVKFTGEYMSGRYKSTYTSSNPFSSPDETSHKMSGFRAYFGPLGFLSLNIHL